MTTLLESLFSQMLLNISTEPLLTSIRALKLTGETGCEKTIRGSGYTANDLAQLSGDPTHRYPYRKYRMQIIWNFTKKSWYESTSLSWISLP